MNSYIKHLLKKYLPFYIVLFAVCISIFFIYLTYDNNAYSRPEGVNYYVTTPYSGLLIFIIPLAFVSMIAPIFANSYRYSIKSVDVFYQTGKGAKRIRFMNNLTLLISIIVSYTAAFVIAIVIMFFKQLSNAGQEVVTDYGATYTYIMFNFGYYFLAYFLAVISCAVNYFISYYLITRANNAVNSIICLVLGQLLLSALVMTPIWYALIINGLFENSVAFYNVNILFGTRVPSIIGPIALIANIFEPLIVSGEPMELILSEDDIFSFVLSIVNVILFFSLGASSIFAFINEKESSGELAGKPEGRDKMQMIIFHAGAGLIFFWSGIANGFISVFAIVNVFTTISSFVMLCALYYVFYGLIRRNFKLKKNDFAILIPVVSVYILSAISYNIVVNLAN